MFALLFPGQGSQRGGMLHAAGALPGGAAIIAQANRVLGSDLLACDDCAAYRSTHVTQIALVVCGIIGADALAAQAGPPAAVAGHSAGAYAAAVAAGALDIATALAAIDRRGRAMEAAFPHGYGMGAVTGLDERRVAQIVARRHDPQHPVFAANVNAHDQTAIAGSLDAIDAVLADATLAGARTARRLDVTVPSHSPLMAGVVAQLDAALPDSAVRRARVPYALNADGRLTRDAGRIRHDLVTNAAAPVRWGDALQALYEAGCRTFIELLPGSVLTDVTKAAFPDVRALALETAGFASCCEAARRAR